MSKRKYCQKTPYKERGWAIFVLKLLGFGFLLLVLAAFSLFFYYVKDLPRPEIFTERQLPQSSKIYDRSGQVLLYEIYGEEKRTWVPLKDIPEYLKQAVISAEDSNFYHHLGVDLKGIARAILADLRIGKPVYGGSTIPQQLIRSTFLSIEKTAERKTREIILATELVRRYSKDQILEWYLNQIPFGQNAYGVEAASQTYFKKSVSEISLAESATLAALIRAPYRLSPYDEEGKKELLIRKDYVLDRMLEEGYLTKAKAEETKQEEIKFAEKKIEIKAPYFTLWVQKFLEEKYGKDFLIERGLKVYTSLDWKLQETAEEAVKTVAERNKIYNAHNAAMAAIDPKTGEILAMIGGKDFFLEPYPKDCIPEKNCLFAPDFNVATLGKRQPGSAFKPFVYATALKKGYDDETTVIDELTNFGIWGDEEFVPQNYDGKFRGPVTLRQALAQSLNVPSVKVLLDLADSPESFKKVGEEPDSIKTAKDFGITTLKPPYGPAIVLGGWEANLLEMTSAYGVFANDGLRISPTAVLKIEDSKGNIIFENKKNSVRVLESQVARQINDILADNETRAPMFGLRSNMFFEGYEVAAKTGTTENYKDGWIIGYTPSIVTGVWVGNNDGTPMKKEPGIVLAGPIFHYFMEKVLPQSLKENFKKPEPKENQLTTFNWHYYIEIIFSPDRLQDSWSFLIC